MVKTITGIFAAIALLLGLSVWERKCIENTFASFEEKLVQLKEKTLSSEATQADGCAVRVFWTDKRDFLHMILPHTCIETVDYQLNEAIGYISEKMYEDALPKLVVLIEFCEKLPACYRVTPKNLL